jgi:predicted dehydrogenase
MNDVLRVAMIGAGWVTRHHLPAWRVLGSQARVVGVADPSREAREERAAEFGIPSNFANFEEMLDSLHPDAVDICSPREFHGQHVRAAAARGIAILCQKPLAPTYAEAEALVREVQAKARLMIHENWRFRPYYRLAQTILQNGEIGRIRQVRMVLESSGLVVNESGEMPGLVRQPFIASLDRMLVSEILIHHLDTLRFLLGPLRMVASNLGRSTAEIRGEDRATLTMMGSQRSSVLLIGDMAVHGASPTFVDSLRISGESGMLSLVDGTINVHRGHETVFSQAFDLPQSYQQSYDSVIAHFVHGLRSDGEFETSPRDNLETLRLVEDAYELNAASHPVEQKSCPRT